MAKNFVSDWSTTANDNQDVGGITILGSSPPSHFDGGMREMMAQLRRDVRLLDVYETEAEFVAATIPLVIVSLDTQGYYAAGDGGGHQKRRISTPGAPKAWQKQSADGAWWEVCDAVIVDARWFGVKADGSTDDRVTAQAAIDFADANGGGQVHFPEGTILLSASSGVCLTTYDEVSIHGKGKGATIFKRQAGALGHVFNSAIGSINLHFFDFTIDGNKTAETQGTVAGYHGIRGAGTLSILIERVHVKNCIYYGIGLQGIENLEYDVRITDCDIENNGGWSTSGTTMGDGIDIKSANRVWLTRCRSWNNAQKGFDVRAYLYDIDDCHASGNGDAGFNVRGRGDLGTDIQLVSSIKGGSAISNTGNGLIAFQDDEVNVGYISITGFKALSNSQYGIYINDALMSATIAGNHCISNSQAGIRSIANTSSVIGNVMLNNGTYGFDNGAQNLRHTVIGNIATGNPTANIRAVGGALAVHANNITA